MQSKRCSKCGETKTSAEFRRDRTRRDGLSRRCKECSCAYDRAYHETCREERRAYRLAYYEAHKEEHTAQVRKSDQRRRSTSREVATRNGEPWTPAEDKVVLTSEGTELDIAIELGRTTSSVNSRRKLLRRRAVVA